MIHVDFIEQFFVGHAVVVFIAGCFADDASDDVRCSAGVIEYFSGLIFGGRLCGIEAHVAYFEEHVCGAAGAAVVFFPFEAAALVHEVVECYAVSLVVLPGIDGGGVVDFEFSFFYEYSDHCIGEAFCHGPSELPCISVEAGRVSFGDDAAVVYDEDCSCVPGFMWARFGEGAVEHGIEGVVVYGGVEGIGMFVADGPCDCILVDAWRCRDVCFLGADFFFICSGDEGAAAAFAVDGFAACEAEDGAGG